MSIPSRASLVLHLALVWAVAAAPASPQDVKPGSPEAILAANVAFQRGAKASAEGLLDEARAQFAEVVRLAPQIPDGHDALGSVLIALGRPAEAVTELDTAARLKPGDPIIEGDLARAYTAANQPAKAIPLFTEALKLIKEPEDARFYDSYARALAALGRRKDALAQFAEERKLTGPSAEVDDAIGTVYAQMQRWDHAKAAFQQAVDEGGVSVPPRIHLAVLLRDEQHDLEGALKVLEPTVGGAAPSWDAYPADAWAEYGRTLAAMGSDEQAALALAQAVKENPALPGIAADLAMALQRLGRQEEAIPWFEKAIEDEPKNAVLLSNLGLAMTLTGKAREAMPFLARAQAADPKSANIVKDIGVAHIQLSAFDAAIQDFQSALKLDRADPQLHYDLGLAYKFKDRFDEAAAELAKAGELDPQLEDPPYTLGILYMQMGRLDDAVIQMKRAAEIRPDNGNAWAILGSTLKQDERLDEAKDALEKAIPLLPGQPGPRVTLAGVLAEMAASLGPQADAADSAGDQAKAADLRARIKDLRTQAATWRKEAAGLSQAAVNRQRANFSLNAGNQALLKGRIAEAISRYQESIAADPTFAEPHSQLALAYDRQGSAQEAAQERARAAELEKQPAQ
jgi:tetratricopeptide (TPR) repeat protein